MTIDIDENYVYVSADKSTCRGILRFSHEISVTFQREKEKLIFDSAWHIGVSDMDYKSDEEELFEADFPGLLDEMRKEISKQL